MLHMHGMPRWQPFRRQRLLNRGLLLKRMDNAIQNEGGVTKIPNEALKWVNIFSFITFLIIKDIKTRCGGTGLTRPHAG